MNLKIGITGGIGSGKTRVCKHFEALGVPVYYADLRAKAIMVQDPQVKEKLQQAFGQNIYLAKGELNKPLLKKILFDSPQNKTILESIVHPAVAEDSHRWFQAQAHFPYALKEAALLIESGAYLQMDKIIYVNAPESKRIQWIIERDKSSEIEIRKIMNAQMPENVKIKYADFLIHNDGIQDLEDQVKKIDAILKTLSLSLPENH
jgi:dephospho-CoA kinase